MKQMSQAGSVSAVRRLAAPVATGLIAATLWLIFSGGFANYDTLFALVWGHEIASGAAAQMDLPLAPTPHPLLNLVAVLLSPLGSGAETAVMILAFLSLGWLGYLTYRVTELPFGLLAGLLAAALLLTREPVLSFGSRAYVDIPYLAFLLAALVIELKRSRAGAPVLLLSSLAGLVRPEAWLFAGAYWLYLAASDDRTPPELFRLAILAIASPILWLLSDWVLTGDAFFSFAQTRESTETLGRVTGITNVPITLPRRLGEVAREPVLVGAVLGAITSLLWLRDRTVKLLVIAAISVAAFVLLAAAGLPIITRYVLLPAIFTIVLAAAAVLGWRELDARTYRRERKVWIGVGIAVIALLVAFTPSQLHRLSNLRTSILLQQEIRDDLHTLVTRTEFDASCGPISVPNHRPVPLIALWREQKPSSVLNAQDSPITSGYLFEPATERIARNFILDKRDPIATSTAVPRGFRLVTANRSWKLYLRCSHS